MREVEVFHIRQVIQMSDTYWNEEDSDLIICPYCGKRYEPSYEDTYIGHEEVDCYTEREQTFVCDICKKKIYHVWLSKGMEVSYGDNRWRNDRRRTRRMVGDTDGNS